MSYVGKAYIFHHVIISSALLAPVRYGSRVRACFVLPPYREWHPPTRNTIGSVALYLYYVSLVWANWTNGWKKRGTQVSRTLCVCVLMPWAGRRALSLISGSMISGAVGASYECSLYVERPLLDSIIKMHTPFSFGVVMLWKARFSRKGLTSQGFLSSDVYMPNGIFK